MSIKIKILNASDDLLRYKKSINKALNKAIKKAQAKIPIDNINIVVKEADKFKDLKDLGGVGGYCPSKNFIQLSIDVHHPDFQKDLGEILEKSLIHEIHHAARRQAGIEIDGSSFLEIVFSEGLADFFVYEITNSLSFWIKDMDKKNKKILFDKASRLFDEKFTLESYRDWFISGSKKNKIPKWAGYYLGFDMVRYFFVKNPEQSSKSIIGISVDKIYSKYFLDKYIKDKIHNL